MLSSSTGGDGSEGRRVEHAAEQLGVEPRKEQEAGNRGFKLLLGDLNRCRLPGWTSSSPSTSTYRSDTSSGTGGPPLFAAVNGSGPLPLPLRMKRMCPFHIAAAGGKWRSPEEYRLAAATEEEGRRRRRKTPLVLTHKIDIFSLGLVCYALLARRPPFAALSDSQARAAVVRGGGRPPLTPELCGLGKFHDHHQQQQQELLRTLCEVIRACWHFEPARRPEAAQVARRLSGALGLN